MLRYNMRTCTVLLSFCICFYQTLITGKRLKIMFEVRKVNTISWKESLNSDGQQFYQYQQNEQSSISHIKSVEHKKRPWLTYVFKFDQLTLDSWDRSLECLNRARLLLTMICGSQFCTLQCTKFPQKSF